MLGATGALIGFGAVMTREQVEMIHAWQDGRIDEARGARRRVQRLADVVFAAPVGDYRVRLKECLRILGVLEAAHVRRPLMPLGDDGAGVPDRACSPRSACSSRRRRDGAVRCHAPAYGAVHVREASEGTSHGRRTRGCPDHRRRRVRRCRRPSAGGGGVQGRLPRAGRLARSRRLPGQQARLGAEGPQGLGDQPEHPRPRRRTTRSSRTTRRSRR